MSLKEIETTPSLERFKGFLGLEFARNSRGKTILSRRLRSGLFHLSKEHWDEDQLVVQVLNPTAGIFEGDHLDSRVVVGMGANACLLSPSSNQVYAMLNGGEGTSFQSFQVEENGALTIIPKWMVLHKDARFRQKTTIHLAQKARLFWVDLLSAGRKHHGEFLEFTSYHSTLEIYREGKLSIKEIIRAGREENRWIWAGKKGSFSYMATFYLSMESIGQHLSQWMTEWALSADQTVQIGGTEVEHDLVVIRLMTRSSLDVLRLMNHLIDSISPIHRISPIYKRIT